MSSSREGGDGTLGGQVMRHWEEIVNHEYLFERHIAEVGGQFFTCDSFMNYHKLSTDKM